VPAVVEQIAGGVVGERLAVAQVDLVDVKRIFICAN